MNLYVKKLRTNAILPTRSTPDSAGADLYACVDSDIIIKKGSIVKIPTGLAVEPELKDIVICIFARSGLASKHGITLANSVGIVDADYRGEIIVPLINNGTQDFVITPDMRIAQLIVMPIIFPTFIETDSVSDSERGAGGFGSTGLV